jgi:uncharacterized membrane protein YtjA (UPF0391 family)
MAKWILILLAIAIIAAALGFGGIAKVAAGGAFFLIAALVVGITLAFLIGFTIFRRLT